MEVHVVSSHSDDVEVSYVVCVGETTSIHSIATDGETTNTQMHLCIQWVVLSMHQTGAVALLVMGAYG